MKCHFESYILMLFRETSKQINRAVSYLSKIAKFNTKHDLIYKLPSTFINKLRTRRRNQTKSKKLQQQQEKE